MARKLSNSLEAMGLERFINTKYPTAGREGKTPYERLVGMFDGPDTAIAETFVVGLILTRAAPGRWRKRHKLEEQHPELRQGGTLEEIDAKNNLA